MDSNYLHSSRLANRPCRLGSGQKAAAAVGIKEKDVLAALNTAGLSLARPRFCWRLFFPFRAGGEGDPGLTRPFAGSEWPLSACELMLTGTVVAVAPGGR